MADLVKCTGKDCPLRETCLRYTAIEGELFQRYTGPLYDTKAGNCWNYLAVA